MYKFPKAWIEVILCEDINNNLKLSLLWIKPWVAFRLRSLSSRHFVQFFLILKFWNSLHFVDKLFLWHKHFRVLCVYVIYCLNLKLKCLGLVLLFEAIQIYSYLSWKTPVPLARSTASERRLFSRTSPRTTRRPFADVLPRSKRRLAIYTEWMPKYWAQYNIISMYKNAKL